MRAKAEKVTGVGPTFQLGRWSWTTTGTPSAATAEMAIHAGM